MDVNNINDLNQLEEQENSFLKFDKRILFITLQKKLLMIFAAAMIATIIGGIYSKVAIKNKWQARSVMLRHQKNMSSQQEMPYLYQVMDYNTVLQSIKLRRNLQTVIDSLKLDTTPDKFYHQIEVKRGGKANLINILAMHENRDTAVKIANLIAETFIENYVSILNSSTQKIYNFYIDEKASIKEKLKINDQLLEEFRSKHHILSLEQETQYKYENLGMLEMELMNNQLNVAALQTKIADIIQRMSEMPDKVALETLVSLSQEKQLNDMKNELSLMMEKYTEKNPKVQKLKDEIKTMEGSLPNTDEIIPDLITYGESELKKSLQLEKAQYEIELLSTLKKIDEYQARINSTKQELKELSPLEREYFDITNGKTTLLNQLDKVENRLVDLKIAIDSNVSDFEIIEKAVPPRYPEASGRKLVTLVFGFLTFAGLLVYFVAREFLDFSVKSEVDFKDIFKIKLLSEIPNKDSVLKPVFYSQIQILLGQLSSNLPQKKPLIVTVGSDVPETGSSFIIQEISEMLISQNKRILWIESLQEKDEEIDTYIINTTLYNKKEIPNIQFNKISEQLHKAYFLADDLTFKIILSPDQLKAFLDQLGEYDYIFWELFDVHFNLQLFTTIVSNADVLTFVTRFRQSNRTNLHNAIEFLKENTKVPIFGILNDVPTPYFRVK
jgi:capsular polysaccharide biosynthesis protein